MNYLEGKVDKTIKVLYIVSTLANSGPTNQLYNLVSNMPREVFEPIIMTLSPEPPNSGYHDFNRLGIRVVSLSLSRIAMLLRGRNCFIKNINEINPDIIHTCGLRPDIYTQKYIHKIIHCSTLRNYPYEDYCAKFGALKGMLMSYLHISAIRKIPHTISCSYSIAEKYKNKQAISTQVIQNGINNQRYSPADPKERGLLRTLLQLPDQLLFIFVGALIERKDPLQLIKAFQSADLSDQASLIILGDGPLYDQCLRCSKDNIIMRGKVENVSDYLKACDIFVSPSHSEGLPNSVLEAMGIGLPVILSDIEAHHEIFRMNQDVGCLYSEGSMEELVRQLRASLYWDKQEMGRSSHTTVERYFSAERMSLTYQRMYQELIAMEDNQDNHQMKAVSYETQ